MNPIKRLVPSLLIFFALGVVPETTVDVNASAARGSSAPDGTYNHDAKGLEKEWAPFLKAVSKRDAASIDETYKIFVIPDYQAWFGNYFKKEDVEQLGWDYEAESENGKHSTITMTNLLGGSGGGLHAHCKPAKSEPQTRFAPRADAPLPLQAVPVEQFEVAISLDNGKRFSILANYVYVDGAFRYVGRGAYPFWSMPDASHPKH